MALCLFALSSRLAKQETRAAAEKLRPETKHTAKSPEPLKALFSHVNSGLHQRLDSQGIPWPWRLGRLWKVLKGWKREKKRWKEGGFLQCCVLSCVPQLPEAKTSHESSRLQSVRCIRCTKRESFESRLESSLESSLESTFERAPEDFPPKPLKIFAN